MYLMQELQSLTHWLRQATEQGSGVLTFSGLFDPALHWVALLPSSNCVLLCGGALCYQELYRVAYNLGWRGVCPSCDGLAITSWLFFIMLPLAAGGVVDYVVRRRLAFHVAVYVI